MLFSIITHFFIDLINYYIYCLLCQEFCSLKSLFYKLSSPYVIGELKRQHYVWLCLSYWYVHIYIRDEDSFTAITILYNKTVTALFRMFYIAVLFAQLAISDVYVVVNLGRNAKLSLVKSIFVYLFIYFSSAVNMLFVYLYICLFIWLCFC
jgi:hypothetical protein